MNNDRELLELAARAMGYADAGLQYNEKSNALHDGEGFWFDPLNSGEDSMNMAIKFRFDMMFHGDIKSVFYDGVQYAENGCIEPKLACYRAITRAAAEIGKAMG